MEGFCQWRADEAFNLHPVERAARVHADFVNIHPFVDAYIKKGLVSTYRKWRMELGRKFKILPDQSLAYLQYKVLDKDRNELDLKEEKDIDSSATKNKNKAKNRSKEVQAQESSAS